jgi:PAS domain S-box-containing protein
LTTTPFGLLAPIGALYLYAEGRAVLLLRAALAIAFIGTAIAAYSYADARHDLLLSWAAFFAVALCVGESVAAKASGSLRADAVQAMRIIESMPAHTWSASPDGHITYVSASTLSYIGQLADKPGLFHILDDAGWRRAIHPDDYPRVMEKRRHSLKTGAPFDAEYRVRHCDGTYRWFWFFGSPSRDGHDRVAGWVWHHDRHRREEAGGRRAAGERAAASAAYRRSGRADLEHHARWNAILRQQTIHGRYRCHS